MTVSRRQMMQGAVGLAASSAVVARAQTPEAEDAPSGSAVKKGRIRQTVCKWCYGSTPLETLCEAAAEMGLVGLDLIDPKDFPTLEQHGLVCSMTPSHGIGKGLNDPANHEDCLGKIAGAIEATAAAGWRNVICFSGNRRDGLSDAEGLENCAEALKQVMPQAEKAGVTVQMELLNSKVNHKGYMCDRTPWGVDLVQAVGSDRFRLLYDIYHMQIMEGDVIRTIREHHPSIGHYHTAGNPGRNEMDDTQELLYPPIVRAIVETGYAGFLGQEFIPKGDPLDSLKKMVALCDV